MNCPGCRSNLETAVYHEVEVDLCEVCSGLWLDHKEVDLLFAVPELPKKLLTEPREKPLISIPEGSRTCPRCREFLVLVTVDGITLDVCSQCYGLFLDSGEFAELALAAEKRHRRSTGELEVPDEAQASEELEERVEGSYRAEPSSRRSENKEGWQEALSLVAYRLGRWYDGE